MGPWARDILSLFIDGSTIQIWQIHFLYLCGWQSRCGLTIALKNLKIADNCFENC